MSARRQQARLRSGCNHFCGGLSACICVESDGRGKRPARLELARESSECNRFLCNRISRMIKNLGRERRRSTIPVGKPQERPKRHEVCQLAYCSGRHATHAQVHRHVSWLHLVRGWYRNSELSKRLHLRGGRIVRPEIHGGLIGDKASSCYGHNSSSRDVCSRR